MAKRANKPDRPLKSEHWVGLGEWGRWKREVADPVYYRAAMEVLNSAGKVTRQKYLEMLLEMEEKYPGRGWRQQMDELEAFCFKHGLALKEFPRSKQIG